VAAIRAAAPPVVGADWSHGGAVIGDLPTPASSSELFILASSASCWSGVTPIWQQDQLRSVIASPAMMAWATGEGSDPSSANPSWIGTAGWAIIRGPVPRCGQVAVWTRNGWHKKTSPARPVACATGLHSTDGRQNSPSALVPASPYGARNSGVYRCEPQTSRVGASSSATSVNSSSASSPRPRERTLTQYPPGPS
jgi:hypothetical protein